MRSCFGRERSRRSTYPGDLGVYFGETVQAGRLEWNGYTPVMWPQYHHRTAVQFKCEVDLAESEEVEVRADRKRRYRLKFADSYYGELNHYGMYWLKWAEVRRRPC